MFATSSNSTSLLERQARWLMEQQAAPYKPGQAFGIGLVRLADVNELLVDLAWLASFLITCKV